MIHTKQEYKIGDNVELMWEMPTDSIDTIVTSPPYWSLPDHPVVMTGFRALVAQGIFTPARSCL